MSDTYTKLFSSITESTVWGEPYSTRIVWVAMLAMADARGNVYGAVPGLARRANVTLPEAEAALLSFLSPDPYSRTKTDDGRRIEEIDGGWRLINHAKYGAVRDAEERKEYKRQWDRENRPSGHKRKSDSSPTAVRQDPTNPTEPTPLTPTPTLDKAKAKALVQRSAARFAEFWDGYPVKKGKAAAEKAWRSKGCDAIADQVIEHVRLMQAHDDDWRRGFVPHGSTYVNGERWQDQPKRGPPQTGQQGPQSKTLSAIQRLEGMKHGLADSRTDDRVPEVALLGAGSHPGDRLDRGDGNGVGGSCEARALVG